MSLIEQTRKLTEEFIASQSAQDQETIRQALTRIMESDAGNHALQVGDQAYDFRLPNAKGGESSLYEQLKSGPVVLSFYRGGWCPYCNLEFKALSDILPRLQELGAALIGVSPELPDNSMHTVERQQLKFDVLSDVGNRVARQYGIVMTVPTIFRPLYLQWGLDVPAVNGDDSWELPIPATYIINSEGRIESAYVNKNYTERMEPAEIIRVLESMTMEV